MRKLGLLSAVVALALAAPSAFADGPSGSHEEDGSQPTWDNQVTCGSGTATPVGVVYAGSNGVEVCNGGSGAVPLQGRIIASTDEGGYVAADGDADNSAEAQGWIRIDQSGVRCGDMTTDDGTPAGNGDATHPTPGTDTQEDCG